MGDELEGVAGHRGDGELGRLIEYADSQERRVQELQITVAQLQFALEARVLIERAVGMLAERLGLPVYDAFEVIRSAARNSRREVRSLAEELLEDRGRTPREIVEASARHARP